MLRAPGTPFVERTTRVQRRGLTAKRRTTSTRFAVAPGNCCLSASDTCSGDAEERTSALNVYRIAGLAGMAVGPTPTSALLPFLGCTRSVHPDARALWL